VAYAEFGLIDGQLGDDTGVDGVIYDQGGPASPGTPVADAPAMNGWGMFLFMLLAGLGAMHRVVRTAVDAEGHY